MLTVNEIREVKFSRAMGGYKADDVDVFLDKIEADYSEFERIIKEYELKVQTLASEIEGFKNSQSSIQNVLVSAQTLADQIVREAKEKSDEIIKQAETNIETITAREKELSQAFEIKAQEQKTVLEKELSEMVNTAQKKADTITAAAEERVTHQQMLFDRLKVEIAAFKSSISAKYKEHLEILTSLPDSVPAEPEYVAKILSDSFDKIPEPKNETVIAEDVSVAEEIEENIDIASTSEPEEEGGFVIGNFDAEEEI